MKIIGLIGLGAMGGAYAKFLLEDNYIVYGIDPDENNANVFTSFGGEILSNISHLVNKSEVIILSLPTVPIFKAVINEIEKNGTVIHSKILIDMNTISLDDKLETRDKLQKLNIQMVDAPVSGTGAQAKEKDIVVMSSGDSKVVNECDIIFKSFSKQNINVGEFGNGIKFKILANLLVTVHNTVTAEALLLGQKAGLDSNMIYEVLNAGAAFPVTSFIIANYTIFIFHRFYLWIPHS